MSSGTKTLLALLLIVAAIGEHRVSPCAAYLTVALLCVAAYILFKRSPRPSLLFHQPHGAYAMPRSVHGNG